jgi:dTDP-4-amino-4,6-dideoxyglucose formyltransferase
MIKNRFYNNVLIISDNIYLCNKLIEVINDLEIPFKTFTFSFTSRNNKSILLQNNIEISPLIINEKIDSVIQKYDLVISAHCKQLFKKELIEKVKCINIHPGLNPYNRGWYPQVFSIINGLPLGATIHEIDSEIDHGPIIAQREIALYEYDTSLSAYNKVIETEIDLIRQNLIPILQNNYKTFIPEEGNLNLKKDFSELCLLDLDKVQTVRETINHLRALSHSPFNNAYFFEKNSKKKVWVNLNIIIED